MGIHACTLAYNNHMVLCIKVLIKMLLKWDILKKGRERIWGVEVIYTQLFLSSRVDKFLFDVELNVKNSLFHFFDGHLNVLSRLVMVR